MTQDPKKVAVITGASSGIGKALAEVFGSRGYRVVLSGRNTANLQAVADALLKKGVEVLAVAGDIGIEADCKALVEKSVAAFGRIDVWINNAGISMRALFTAVELDVLKKIMDTNFWGAVYCTKYALPHLLLSRGSLVGISSIAGKKGLPGRTGYSASKFALEGFLETIRTEYLRKHLHVLVVCPGFTASNIRNTAMAADGSIQGESPRKEQSMMQPHDVAEAVFNAVRKRRRDLVLTTSGKFTVWMNKFFPAFMDRMVYKHMAKEPGSPFS